MTKDETGEKERFASDTNLESKLGGLTIPDLIFECYRLEKYFY